MGYDGIREDNMNAFLVIGMGRFGSSVAMELYKLKNEVLVLDEHEEHISDISGFVTNAIIGDSKDEGVLRSLGVPNFDCVIVAMAGALEDSILTTVLLKEMNAKYIVCKAQNDRHAKILTMVGADKVIRPESDTGIRIAHSLSNPNFIDYLEISPEHGVLEIITPMRWVGKSIEDNNLRKKYGITVISVMSKETGKVNFSPSADKVLYKNDVLTLIGSKQDLDRIDSLK